MSLTTDDLRVLGEHLARLLPSYGDRARIARDAGVADTPLSGASHDAWTAVLTVAHERGELGLVLRLASRHRPESEDLAAWATAATAGHLVVPPIVTGGDRIRDIAVSALLVALLGAGAIVGDLARGDADPPTVEHHALEVPVDVPVEPPDRDAAPATPPEGLAAEPEGAPEADPVREPAESAQPTPDVVPAGVAPSDRSPPCPGEPGQVVGYAHAGRASPGQRGDIWLLRQSAYVRADYPRAENRWSARAKAVCALPVGTRVELRRAPIAVDGGAWWVPIVVGATTP